jgi:glycosyltransferase involved in cell wall biosynthesis
VTAGDTALYAKPNEEGDFARQLLRLMDDEHLRDELGESGRRRVTETLTWEHQEGHLLSAYRALERGARALDQDKTEHLELAACNR